MEDNENEDVFGNVADFNADEMKVALEDMKEAVNEMEVPEGENLTVDNANQVEGDPDLDKAEEPLEASEMQPQQPVQDQEKEDRPEPFDREVDP